MSKSSNDAHQPQELGAGLEDLVAGLSGPLIPDGRRGTPAPDIRQHGGPGGTTVDSASGPRDDPAASLRKRNKADTAGRSGGARPGDDLPADVEALAHSIQAGLFPEQDRLHLERQGSGGASPQWPARSRALPVMAAVLTVLVVALATYALITQRHIGQLQQEMTELRQLLSEQRRVAAGLADSIHGLQQSREIDERARQNLGQEIDAVRRDTGGRMQTLARQVEQLRERIVVREQPLIASAEEEAAGDDGASEQTDLGDQGRRREEQGQANTTPRSTASARMPVDPTTSHAAAIDQPAWVVNLASFDSQAEAVAQAARLREQGVEASIQEASIKGKSWYRLRVGAFADAEAARSFTRRYRDQPEFGDAWISRER